MSGKAFNWTEQLPQYHSITTRANPIIIDLPRRFVSHAAARRDF
jgi:hypothetical protein